MNIRIAPLAERDLPEADRIFRLAFGTFLGLPDPMSFAGDSDHVRSRWRADPSAAIGAYADGALVGSCFASRWGSFGFFGPLSVRPDLWNGGIAKRLLDATMAIFATWGITRAGLFTFPHSRKHVALYQRFGFWPQRLTALMSKAIAAAPDRGEGLALYSTTPPGEQPRRLAECAALTGTLAPGLDVASDIRAVQAQRLGETIFLHDADGLAALAVCHIGRGTEAGSGTTYVKFGAARPGPDAEARFTRLLAACETLAAERDTRVLAGGVNTARGPAYRMMLDRGFRTTMHGVAMQRPDVEGTNRPDCFVIDDWR
jgi:predicted N-acetyltransferase YhbS